MRTRRQISPGPPSRRTPARASKIRGLTAASSASVTIPRAARLSARNLRRTERRARPSDGDHSDDNDAPLATRRNLRNLRKRPCPESPDPLSYSPASKRARPQAGFYEQDSSDEGQDHAGGLDEEHEEDDQDDLASHSHTSPSTDFDQSTSPAKRQKSPTVYQHNQTCSAATETPIIPDWASLPYFILLQIFRFGFASLDDRAAVNWLLGASQLCRAFAEPALTALYETPPLLTRSMAHRLLDLISKDPSQTLFNYRQKVERLQIDVGGIAAKTYRGQHLDFEKLVSSLPRLNTVDFYHQKDNAPYRQLNETIRWSYPTALFRGLGISEAIGLPTRTQSLEESQSGEHRMGQDNAAAATAIGLPTRTQSLDESRSGEHRMGQDDAAAATANTTKSITKLRGWRWNSRLMGSDLHMDSIKQIHATQPFSGLLKLSFVNVQLPSLPPNRLREEEAVVQDRAFVQSLADSVNALPNLESLSFESSTVVNDMLFALLPKTLRSLTLVNCWDVNADDLAEFLTYHGSKMRHLALHHNQSLSLAFTTVLGCACPQLRSLCMDFKYYKHHEFYNDSDPAYDNVLEVNQTPTWPLQIETIELRNVRMWDLAAAEVLFKSLVDNAANLTKLRRLDLKIMLPISHRQRSKVRDEWAPKLKEVFLRRPTDPLPFHSLRSSRQEITVSSDSPSQKKTSKSQKSRRSATVGRRSSRIASQESSRSSSISRSMRTSNGRRSRPSYAEPDTDEDIDLDDEEEQTSDESHHELSLAVSEPCLPIQGMCEVVNFQLDNQKVTERTYDMGDFLDSESDDPTDEDWTGDQEVDEGYAW